MATHSNGLQIIDISNPSNPFLVGGYAISSPIKDVAIHHGCAYFSYYDISGAGASLYVLTISNPPNYVQVTKFDEIGFARDIIFNGNIAYVTCEGLHVLDFSNPLNPVQIGYCDSNYITYNTAIAGNYVSPVTSKPATGGRFKTSQCEG